MVYIPRKFKPHEMSRKVEFGVVESKRNEHTGSFKEAFVKSFSMYYASVDRGLKIESQLEGTRFQDTVSIAVRHNSLINEQLVVRVSGDVYGIVKIQSDDTNTYNGFDLVVLSKLGK